MSLGFCLVTTKTWSDDSKDPLGSHIRVTAFRSRVDRVTALRQTGVPARFYLDDSRKIHLWGERACQPETRREECPSTRGRERERAHECTHAREWERGRAFWLLFLYVCFLPPRPALCKLGLVRSAVLPKVLTPASGLPLTFFCSIFLAFPFLGF